MEDQEQVLKALGRSAESASKSAPASKPAVGQSRSELDIDAEKSKADLIEELQQMRRRVAELSRRNNSPVNDERSNAQQLQDMFQLIIDTIPVSIWWKDRDSRFLGCNLKVAQAAGFENPHDMIGKSDYDCPWKKEESDWFVEWDQKVMAQNRAYHHIIEPKLTADGTQAWLDTTKVPLHDSQGNVIGTLGTYEDITERKLAEMELRAAHAELAKTHAELSKAHADLANTHEELQASNALLEERVAERTMALEATNSQLKDLSKELLSARDQAMEASKYKSNFLANMSHEIRTPLNSVVAVTELLLKTKLTGSQQEFVDIIQHSSRSLLEIVQDILDMSKIEAGKVELVTEDFDVFSVVETVTELLRTKAEEKDLKLSFRFDGVIPVPLKGDAARIRQVLINLVSNAIKFTSVGSVELVIESSEITSQLCELKFNIIDTGIGLSEATASKVFEPFTQADGSITRRYGGTGLGLSICKELVQLMGGELGVQSTENVGSCFWFTLRIKPDDNSVLINPNDSIIGIQNSRAYEAPTAKASRTGRSGIVLVADDSPLNRKVTLLVLHHLGYRGYAVNNGQEAVDAMKTGSYDLVLMDCQMPVMDGFESTKRIRIGEDESGLRTPIIALTAQAIDGDREKCLESGMDDYLTKPITPDRLAAKLARWLPLDSVKS
ncbi:MAG: ATP-binding protein [Candidatus Melainabacteria bacterium]|nr:ATP-binding protein [Candidatus Melainabacteria bacterium]